jgi:hypothetical protein
VPGAVRRVDGAAAEESAERSEGRENGALQRHRRLGQRGAESPRSRKATAICRRPGIPLLFLFPSRPRPKKVSKNVSVSSAGRNSTRTTASSCPSFHQRWGAPAGTVAPSPLAGCLKGDGSGADQKALLLASVEVLGGDGDAGSDVEMKESSSPPVAWTVSTQVIRSLVTGFSMASPALAIIRRYRSGLEAMRDGFSSSRLPRRYRQGR